jgi:hypothetical protein
MILLDKAMPEYDRREVHRRRIHAPADAIWAAAKELRGDEMTVMRALMGIRTLGRGPRAGDRTVLASFRGMGFRLIAEEPGRELVVAGIGRFWLPSGGLRKVESSEQFAAFAEPRYAKVAFNFRLEGLSTETRIAGTDAHARRRFGAYWLLVRPGSGLIRREWLRAIDKRAQTGA